MLKKVKWLSIRVFLLFYIPLSIYASTSLDDYPQIKSSWDQGELTAAIVQLKKVANSTVDNGEIVELIKKITFQKNKLDQWIEKATLLLKQQKFKDAREILAFAKTINPKYSPYRNLINKIKTDEEKLKYPSKIIFDGKSLADNWKSYDYDGKFSNYAKFSNSSLLLDVPKGHGWARIGIESNNTIINFTEKNQLLSYHLKFKFDPKDTTGFAIDLEGENLDKKSRSSNKISVVYKVVNEKSALLELRKDGYLHTKLEMSTAPESMELIIQPNNFMYLNLPDGRHLQTTSVRYPMPTKGYKLKVYSQARKYKSEVKMALKSIELRNIPFKKKKVKTVIFDGKYLEDVWKPYEAHKHYFSEYARFDNNTFMVNVPQKHGWGQVGLESSDTIIDFTEIKQSLSYHLKFKFDPKNTTGFAIDLEGKNLDKSHTYNKLQIFYKKIDDKSAVLELHKGYGALHTKLEMGSIAPESMELVVQPNNMMYLYLPDGRHLQTTSAEHPMPTKGYILKVYSKPKQRQLSSKMSLKSIELKKLPFEKRFDPSNLEKKEGKIVLFDGKYLENRWIPYNEQYQKYFREYAKFSDHKLMIDIPKKHKWGEAGILSPEPLVWLDELGKEGEIKTTFSFDPLETSGFSIAAGGLNRSWKTPSGEYINLSWTKVEDKDISKLRFKIKNKLLLDENLTGKAPSTITLSFKNTEISIEGDTFGKKTFEWSHLVENRALHLWVFSHAYKKNIPVKMALKKIELDRKFGEPLPTAKPAKGVSLLAEKEIYGSETLDKWRCYEETEKGKESNCTLGSSNLVISIPKEAKSTFGMKSKEKIISLDMRRIKETPLKMVIYFNPKKTDHFDITIGKYHVLLKKKSLDSYAFKWGKTWSRNIDAKWLKNEWNGKVNITMAKDWTKIEIDGSVAIHTSDKMSGKFPLYVLVAPLNTPMKDGANLELKKITTQWLVPEGMTAIDRWELIDNEDFNPDEFLNELREEK